MAESKFNEATLQLTQSFRETNQAIAESAVAAQERNVRYAQSTFENGIEVLKGNAEDTRSLIREVVEQPSRPQEAFQAVIDRAAAAQERNMRYAQSILENGNEVFKSHAESTRALWQTVLEQSKRQQDAFQTLVHETVDAYIGFWSAPFSYYQQAWDTAGSIARQGVETAQNVTRQGFYAAQQVARQGFEAAQKAAQEGQEVAQSATE